MEPPKRDFFDILATVIDKSVIVSEKSIENAIPIASSWLERFEKWLDSKLDDPQVPQ